LPAYSTDAPTVDRTNHLDPADVQGLSIPWSKAFRYGPWLSGKPLPVDNRLYSGACRLAGGMAIALSSVADQDTTRLRGGGTAMCEVCGDPMHKLDDDAERSTARGPIDNACPAPPNDDDYPQP
jgi:hypothetical protein